MEAARYDLAYYALAVPSVFEVVRDIHRLARVGPVEVHVGQLQHIDPFGMLLFASAVRRARKRTSISIVGRDDRIQAHQYASYLGFWRSLGEPDDGPQMHRANVATVPVSTLSYAKLYREAGADPIRAELVLAQARGLAATLTDGKTGTSLGQALGYAFHEIFRNSMEHGGDDLIWFCGATRPKKNDVQVAILDEGRGIRASLAANKNYVFENDADAISAALQPGVSGSRHRKRSPEQLDRLYEQFPGRDPKLYDNSGYGLTVTSLLALEVGRFAIASGDAAIVYPKGEESRRVVSTQHEGTAIGIVLRRSEIQDGLLEAALRKADKRDATGLSKPLVSASRLARLGFSVPPVEPPATTTPQGTSGGRSEDD